MDKHESIIISPESKNVLIYALLLVATLIAMKWLVIGYWLGKRECE